MKFKSTYLERMNLDELTEHIISKMDINLQLKIVGDEYYYSFMGLEQARRKDIIVSALTQMPEDILEDFIKSGL